MSVPNKLKRRELFPHLSQRVQNNGFGFVKGAEVKEAVCLKRRGVERGLQAKIGRQGHMHRVFFSVHEHVHPGHVFCDITDANKLT